MRLTVDLPWFTYPRRLAIMVIATLLLLAIALPASAAPPTTEVTVVNEPDDPVPVTVENDVAVTGGNNTPVNVSGEVTVGNVDPLGVSGNVNATVQGAVDVNGQTYDTDGNLNVTMAPQLTTEEVGIDITFDGPRVISGLPAHVTGLEIRMVDPDPGDRVLGSLELISGDTFNFTIFGDEPTYARQYPFPLAVAAAGEFHFTCGTSPPGGDCRVQVSILGY